MMLTITDTIIYIPTLPNASTVGTLGTLCFLRLGLVRSSGMDPTKAWHPLAPAFADTMLIEACQTEGRCSHYSHRCAVYAAPATPVRRFLCGLDSCSRARVFGSRTW